MSRCGAGECDCECGGNKGCGCWASSDDPGLCDCHCYGTAFGGGQSLPVNALVDVSISGLPLLDAAKFLNSFHSEQVLVPTDLLNKLSKRVHLKVKRTRLSDIVKRLGLVTSGHRKERKTKRKARFGLEYLLANFVGNSSNSKVALHPRLSAPIAGGA
jgi:hypothetical protein